MEKLPPRPEAFRTLSNEESSRLDATRETHYDDTYCVTCGGARQFRWYVNREIAEFECDCSDQYVMYRYLLNAGVGLHYQRLGWDDIDGGLSADVQIAVLEFLADPGPRFRQGVGWFFFGPFGTGKTMLATLILKKLLAFGYDGYFTTFTEMLEVFKATWSSPEERRWFHRQVRNASILVIDDPGREHSRIADTTLDEVIRHRVASETPTIITTNKTIDEFEAKYGENITSLLVESATTHEVTGASFREAMAERQQRERALGLTRPIVVG